MLTRNNSAAGGAAAAPVAPAPAAAPAPAERPVARSRDLPAWAILVLAFLCLIVGHLLLREYMPNPAIGAVGFILLAAIQGYVLLGRDDLFGFAMIVYICSHFSYADNQGGLWALTAGVLLVGRAALGYRNEKLPGRDVLAYTLLGVIVTWNLVGLILRNPAPYLDRAEGLVSFIGFVLVFLTVSNLAVTPARFRTFLVITATLFVYQAAIAINNRYAVFNWNTPLIGAYNEGQGAITYRSTNAWGTLRHSELFGEYGALFWTLLVPILCCSRIQKEVRFGVSGVVLAMTLALLVIAITSTRSAALLVAAAVMIYFFLFTAFSFSAIDRFGRQIQLGIVLALLIPIAGAYVGLDSLEQNFAELRGEQVSTTAVLSGQAINRAPLFDFAMRRIGEESLLVGYGFGTLRANLWAWTGVDPARVQTIADFHSLYFSLPFVYGWPGTLAFLWLIVLTAWRSWLAALKYARRKTFLVAAALGFAVFWFVFLVDQFKISALRIPTYHMLFWIWLGLTTAVTRTLVAAAARPPAAAGAPPASAEAAEPAPARAPRP